MRRYIQTHIEDPLAERIIADYGKTLTHASVGARDGKLRIEAL